MAFASASAFLLVSASALALASASAFGAVLGVSVYGVSEATAKEAGLASFWSSGERVDQKRLLAEQHAFAHEATERTLQTVLA